MISRLIRIKNTKKIIFVACLMLGAAAFAQEKKEIRCYWMGSSSSPMRLVKTFDAFVNAGKGYSTRGSVRGDTIRLDRMAVPGNTERPLNFKGFNKGEFDYAIIQVSMGFVRDQQAIDGMGAMIADICTKVRERGAKPVFWEAYAATPDKASGQDVVQMQVRLHQELLKAAAANHAIFVPAGSPWQEVRMSRAGDRLYMFSPVTPNDIGHTGPRGNFILGAAIYAAVTGENPIENPNLTTYEMDPSADKNQLWGTAVPVEIDPKEAALFKEVVWKHELKARSEYIPDVGKIPPVQSAVSAASPAASAALVLSQPDPGLLDIYLIMGEQSAIAGKTSASRRVYVLDQATAQWRNLGPETDGDGGVGAALAARFPDREIGLIFCGVDGSGLSDWQEGKKNYNRAMTLAQEALRSGTLRGCIWVSKKAAEHEEAFQRMVKAFRAEVPSENLPFFVLPPVWDISALQ
jgi:hypothetical protein